MNPGTLTGIDQVFYQIANSVTAVVYGLYAFRDPNVANLAPMRERDFNCVAQRVIEHFETAVRGQGLTPTRFRNIQDWKKRVRETGASVAVVAELEKILKRAIVLKDITGEYIYNSGKYQSRGMGVELIVHNAHAWSKRSPLPAIQNIHEDDGCSHSRGQCLGGNTRRNC